MQAREPMTRKIRLGIVFLQVWFDSSYANSSWD